MTFHLTFSSFWVAELGKELHTRLAMCSHCICLFVILVISRFGFLLLLLPFTSLLQLVEVYASFEGGFGF